MVKLTELSVDPALCNGWWYITIYLRDLRLWIRVLNVNG